MWIALIIAPVLIVAGYRAVLKEKENKPKENVSKKQDEAAAETGKKESHSQKWEAVSAGDIERIAFNKKLYMFLKKQFPKMERYYNDDPCNVYDKEIFFVNIVYENGKKEKVFLRQIPQIGGIIFRLLDEKVPENTPENTPEDTPEDKTEDATENAPEELSEDVPEETKNEETDFVKDWLDKNLKALISNMKMAEAEQKDVFVYDVPDNDEIRTALQTEGFYIYEDSETNDTYVSF